MKIAFYAPFKPLDHPNPSGDLVIARGICNYLAKKGHKILTPANLRCRWIYLKPWLWPLALKEYKKAAGFVKNQRPDIWITYHTYYKSPDILGPFVCPAHKIPYIIFQGIYSTKRRKKPLTYPGFILNRHALLNAARVFTNKKDDFVNLKRLLPDNKLTYVPPGIYPEDFKFDANAGKSLREKWKTKDKPVILSAAMFRPDVKTLGLKWLIRSCARIAGEGFSFFLVIAGDGKKRQALEKLAEKLLPGRVIFAGRINRKNMHEFYSAGDIFAFPGIRESLGMVFLESQSCGLPVVAFDNGGIPEVVLNGHTGFLTRPFDENAFDKAIKNLLTDKNLRKIMGKKAAAHIRKFHDLNKNYELLENVLMKFACQTRIYKAKNYKAKN